MYLCLIFLFWVEVGGYIDGVVVQQFSVDNRVKKDLSINLDMIVAMPCNFLHTNVMDITDDQFLAAELLSFQGVNFQLPNAYLEGNDRKVESQELESVMREALLAQFSVQSLHVNEGAPACHIFGSIPVNRVKGDFHITGKGIGHADRSVVPYQALNFTHLINEFSFGDFYPYLVNPLDVTARLAHENMQAYTYYLSVVPTEYRKLGVVVDTNQYSMVEQERVYGQGEGVPGIFFKYDFEPISIHIEENRIPFVQFVVRLATIAGGLIVVISWLYKTFDKLLTLALGKKYAQRGQEKPQNILGQ